MEFENQLEGMQKEVETAISLYLPSVQTPPEELHRAMEYSLKAGGKRLRPVLLLSTARLFPSKIDPLPAAVAIEFLHSYTLIHDDLPAMDDSDLRRGRPSLHIQYDEATAILAGDALLTEAFRLLATAYEAEPAIGLKLIRLLSDASGSQKLIGGQAVDTWMESRKASTEELEFIHRNKTAALLQAALRMGAVTSSAPSETDEYLDQIGLHLGLAFQILDDILDATSDAETMGKTVGADKDNNKNTWVSLYGLEESRSAASKHTNQALDYCARIPANTTFLENLIRYLLHRKH